MVWVFALLPAIVLMSNFLLFPNPLRDYSVCTRTLVMAWLWFFWPALLGFVALGACAIIASIQHKQWIKPISFGAAVILTL